MKKIKIGILGCNYMGKMHADCYSQLDNVEVVAVADLNAESANKIAEKTGAKVFLDASELIEKSELDAIDICLPTFLHTRFALMAMEKVPYVFIEKPVALNQEECEQLLLKQKETGAQVQIGQVIRFWDEYDYLKKLVDSKTYGEVVNATFRRVSPSPTWSSNDWIRNSKLSGGAMVDLHIHDIDFMFYLFGKPLSSNCIKNIRGEKDSYVSTSCVYDDFVVSVEGTWFLPPTFPFSMYYRVVFEQAAVELNNGVVTVYEADKKFSPEIEKRVCKRSYRPFL